MTAQHEATSHDKREAPKKKNKKRKNGAKKRSLDRTVDRSTEAVERLHRAIAGLPLDALERIHRLEKPIARVRKLQDRSITATYKLVRGVNSEVVQLIRETSSKTPRRARARRQPKKARRSERRERVVHSETAASAS